MDTEIILLGSSYQYSYNDIENDYRFVSNGKNGEFQKRVTFKKYGESVFWELVLEDYLEKLDFYSINTVTDNGDIDEIYSTMFSIMIHYSNKYPNKGLITRGTTKIIQRLDKIFLSKYYKEITSFFDVRMFDDSNEEVMNKSFNSKVNCLGYLFYPKK